MVLGLCAIQKLLMSSKQRWPRSHFFPFGQQCCYPVHSSDHRLVALGLFAQMHIQKEHRQGTSDLLPSCGSQIPGVLTACGQRSLRAPRGCFASRA